MTIPATKHEPPMPQIVVNKLPPGKVTLRVPLMIMVPRMMKAMIVTMMSRLVLCSNGVVGP